LPPQTAATGALRSVKGAVGGARKHAFSGQQPAGDEGDDTPGVAGAPVALAGVIMPGVARFIVMLSAQADVLGVGITAIAVAGSMLVSPSAVTSG
jgi:hypothetical protein